MRQCFEKQNLLLMEWLGYLQRFDHVILIEYRLIFTFCSYANHFLNGGFLGLILAWILNGHQETTSNFGCLGWICPCRFNLSNFQISRYLCLEEAVICISKDYLDELIIVDLSLGSEYFDLHSIKLEEAERCLRFLHFLHWLALNFDNKNYHWVESPIYHHLHFHNSIWIQGPWFSFASSSTPPPLHFVNSNSIDLAAMDSITLKSPFEIQDYENWSQLS